LAIVTNILEEIIDGIMIKGKNNVKTYIKYVENSLKSKVSDKDIISNRSSWFKKSI